VSDHNRVIARAFIILAVIALASWVEAATSYADKTDKELTEIAAGWSGLSEDERRALLTEMQARMQVNANKRPVLTIKTERRYGRIVRQPDGSIQIEEHVVYQTMRGDGGDQPFGVGFEQRSIGGDTPTATPGTQQTPPVPVPETMTTSVAPITRPVIPVGSANNH
jgi:hypothetical protein